MELDLSDTNVSFLLLQNQKSPYGAELSCIDVQRNAKNTVCDRRIPDVVFKARWITPSVAILFVVN